ncbi:hypothetical protein Slala03_81440 [Streptomyces lavendulae subsp. lavendulae]|uniref:hypothetical protein n=1 Tax=Streptomyces lavendulae TaxID=1914 RepID=UPI0024A3880E|nr:hypothetical protein [Streptomyces lavendulae]GLV88455.1 hypothetical protein Slala03_81440 [Streptomyces lavendulae subsp. lavendulae]
MGFDKKEAKATAEGALPWLAPTGKLTVEALRKLERPVLAWAPEGEAYRFDSAAYYSEYADEPGGLSPLEKKVAAMRPRPEWTMERIWTPDEDSSEQHHTAYRKASVSPALGRCRECGPPAAGAATAAQAVRQDRDQRVASEMPLMIMSVRPTWYE